MTRMEIPSPTVTPILKSSNPKLYALNTGSDGYKKEDVCE